MRRVSRDVQQVEIEPASIEQLAAALTPERAEHLRAVAERARRLLAGRIVWNVNATAHGGGVAAMLQTLLAYGRVLALIPDGWCWTAIRTSSGSPNDCTTSCTETPGTVDRWATVGMLSTRAFSPTIWQGFASSYALRTWSCCTTRRPLVWSTGSGERVPRVVWRCHIGADTHNDYTE
jgi:trehalose synthase